MELNLENIHQLEEHFDDRYVLQSNCSDNQEMVNRNFANDDKRIDIISHDFKVIKWLVTTVAASSISALVVSTMELILK